jgi:DNA-binding NtrC family response regulator
VSRSILLIDDDPEVLALLVRFFEQRNWLVFRSVDAAAAAALYDRERPDLVLLDLELPGVNGLRLLEALRARDADATVIMLTGYADIATAVEAMRLGAENFLTKPVELPHLEAATERAYEKVELRRRNRYFAERQATGPSLAALGRGPAMREIARQVELLATSEATVLLMGETGTGKGWVAQMLHSMSSRARAPFVEINCAGLSATFLDSELFGHEKGAFTDARQRKLGLLEVAHTGTVFLDEVGDLAGELQPKLLKVLETRRFRRLGGTREIDVDVRMITATNRDLEAAVRSGSFREDLYYRLAVFPLRLPPLRERNREDVADLALAILADIGRRAGRGPARLSAEAIQRVTRYAWPGNIRELRNVIERAALLCGDEQEVRPAHLPPEIAAPGLPAGTASDLELSLEEIERRHIARVLEHCAGNRSRAARTLGISRATLYEKLARYNIA